MNIYETATSIYVNNDWMIIVKCV